MNKKQDSFPVILFPFLLFVFLSSFRFSFSKQPFVASTGFYVNDFNQFAGERYPYLYISFLNVYSVLQHAHTNTLREWACNSLLSICTWATCTGCHRVAMETNHKLTLQVLLDTVEDTRFSAGHIVANTANSFLKHGLRKQAVPHPLIISSSRGVHKLRTAFI